MSLLLNTASGGHTTTTYEFKPDVIKKLIAQDLKVPENQIKVDFVITEVGGDPMDRYPGHKEVTSIRVVITAPS